MCGEHPLAPQEETVGGMEPMMLVFPLLQAASNGDLEGVRSIVSSRADVNAPAPFDERTALHLAAARGHLDVTKYLVNECGAELKRDRSGLLPSQDAKQNGHVDVRCFLQGIEEQQERERKTPLQLQQESVFELVTRERIFARGAIQSEVEHYYTDLGLHPSYFEHFTAAQISRHVQAMMAAKQASDIQGSQELEFVLNDDHCGFFLTTLDASSKHRNTLRQCDQYLTETAGLNCAYSLTFMASSGPAWKRMLGLTNSPPSTTMNGDRSVRFIDKSANNVRVGIYFVDRTHWEPVVGNRSSGDNDRELREETDLQRIATSRFLKAHDAESCAIHQRLVEKAVSTRSTVVEIFDAEAFPHGCSRGKVVALATYEVGGKEAVSLLADLQELLFHVCLEPRRLYIESFANGAATYILHFPDVEDQKLDDLQASVRFLQHMKRTPGLSVRLWDGVLTCAITPEQSVYLRAASKFVYSFFPREKYVPQYAELQQMLHDPASKRKLDELYLQTIDEVITPARIYDILSQNFEFVPKLFEDFSCIAIGSVKPFWNADLEKKIESQVHDPLAVQVLLMLLRFNHSLLITNFFRKGSPPAAIAFRLNAKKVLEGRPRSLFAEVPFGIYLVMGQSFHGFHVRFREISRGGVRLIRSRDTQGYRRNNASLFEECFNLAYTQQLKNKDIPEGGSKGVILLDRHGQHSQSLASGKDCFVKYIDALLDCMLLPEGMANHCSNGEMLFIGPDEGTADCMDVGARRARDRGYPHWKAMTTGKSVQLGGVPHDVYGITTRGVRTYVQELYKVLNLDERSITKFQTGGPDGDLGSNEILQSCDKTTALVDVSGVAYDPNGLCRDELERLARTRQMICKFNSEFLGKGGFLVLVSDEDVVLPDGSRWRTGLELRDSFVLTKYAHADLFVPCGGRPATVNASNVDKLIVGGVPAWKMVVEGANLFLTAEARARLETAGVHVIKDSSANKGGVTSSSLEVLASLAFRPKDHDRLLTCLDDQSELPEFYLKYVDEIIGRIEQNCRDEFRCIWQATQDGESRSKVDVSRRLSHEIGSLTDQIAAAKMNDKLLAHVLSQAIPSLIVDHLGMEALLENVPAPYLKATAAYYLASKYVYETGLTNCSSFAFHQFMKRFGGAMGYPSCPGSPRSSEPASPVRSSAYLAADAEWAVE